MIVRRLLAASVPVAVILACATVAVAGSWPAGVTEVAASSTTVTTVAGNLTTGKTMALTWAAQSAVACFPATEYLNFEGNHVQYATQIPANSEMTITAIPEDPALDISLYAYTIGSTDFTHVAPNVSSVTACEASYDAQTDHNPGVKEQVKLVATTNPYNVVIGVAGVKNVKAGAFKLRVALATKATVTSANLTATTLTPVNGKATIAGNLSNGGVIDLAWAANSSVACFPATENVNFSGNHVLYKVSLPSNSQITVKATPTAATTDVSLYAFTKAAGTATLPPNVTSVVSCEAGYDAAHDNNPGVAESVKLISITAGYDVIIGVAGANGAKAGAFNLEATIAPR